MKDLTFKDIIEYGLWALCIISVAAVLWHWIDTPSTSLSYSGETEYTRCLKLSFEHGTIQDAETFCKHLRKEK